MPDGSKDIKDGDKGVEVCDILEDSDENGRPGGVALDYNDCQSAPSVPIAPDARQAPPIPPEPRSIGPVFLGIHKDGSWMFGYPDVSLCSAEIESITDRSTAVSSI